MIASISERCAGEMVCATPAVIASASRTKPVAASLSTVNLISVVLLNCVAAVVTAVWW